jgi:hypothetical protein
MIKEESQRWITTRLRETDDVATMLYRVELRGVKGAACRSSSNALIVSSSTCRQAPQLVRCRGKRLATWELADPLNTDRTYYVQVTCT